MSWSWWPVIMRGNERKGSMISSVHCVVLYPVCLWSISGGRVPAVVWTVSCRRQPVQKNKKWIGRWPATFCNSKLISYQTWMWESKYKSAVLGLDTCMVLFCFFLQSFFTKAYSSLLLLWVLSLPLLCAKFRFMCFFNSQGRSWQHWSTGEV